MAEFLAYYLLKKEEQSHIPIVVLRKNHSELTTTPASVISLAIGSG
jgi:hypothetical protein